MIKINRKAVTLTEITIAVLIFGIVAVPLYYAISYGSNQEIQVEKFNRANKILESFRDEVKNLDFDTAMSLGENIDPKQLPPNSFQQLLEAQQKHKDFVFSGTTVVNTDVNTGSKSLTFKAEVHWTSGNGNKSSQKITFIKVK